MGDEYQHSHDVSCLGAAMLILPALKAAKRPFDSTLFGKQPRAHTACLSFVVFISSPVLRSSP